MLKQWTKSISVGTSSVMQQASLRAGKTVWRQTATDGIYDPAAAGDKEPQIMANAVKYEPQETGGIII